MGQSARIRPKVVRPLPEHLAELAGIRATGTLVVRDGDAERTIRVVDGHVRCASSNLSDEQLGPWLIHRHSVPESEQVLLLQAQSGGDQRVFEELLAKHGLIGSGALTRELRELALSVVGRAAAALQPELVFLPGVTEAESESLAGVSPAQIMLVAAREVADQKAMLETIGPWELAHCQVPNADEVASGLSLAPKEAFILSRLNQAKTLDSLAAMSHVGREELIVVLYSLKVIGLIELVLAVPPPVYEPGEAEPEPPTNGTVTQPVVDQAALSMWQREERAKVHEMARLAPRLDHYAAMELRHDAPPEAIAEAWRMMRELYSTQRESEPHLLDCGQALATISARVSEAFEVLYDPVARRRYDAVRASLEPSPQVPDPSGEILVLPRAAAAPSADARDAEPTAVESAAQDSGESRDQSARVREAEELVREGDTDGAIRLLEKACAIDPQADVLLRLARLLFQEARWTNRALTTLRRALESDPDFVPAWVELAEFWAGHGRDDRARQALDRALAVDPDHPRAGELARQLAEPEA